MYTITILTKSGNTAIHNVSEYVFQSFKDWLIDGEGTAKTNSTMFQDGLPNNLNNGYHQKPCNIFLFSDGAIQRDNIDTISWGELVKQPATVPRQRIETIDEAPALH